MIKKTNNRSRKVKAWYRNTGQKDHEKFYVDQPSNNIAGGCRPALQGQRAKRGLFKSRFKRGYRRLEQRLGGSVWRVQTGGEADRSEWQRLTVTLQGWAGRGGECLAPFKRKPAGQGGGGGGGGGLNALGMVAAEPTHTPMVSPTNSS